MSPIKNIIVGFLSLILITALLLPSVLKFSHFFIEHTHIGCNEHIKTHFHQTDFECELFKFHHTIQLNYTPEEITFHVIKLPTKHHFNHYFFLSEYQRLHISLRGPPFVS